VSRKAGASPAKETGAALRLRAEAHLAAHPVATSASAADLLRLVHELRVHQIELEMQNEELALAERLEQVREEERTRIGRELHDELGQALMAIQMNLRHLQTSLPEAAQARHFIDIESMLNETNLTLRRITHELRPPILDTLDLGGAIECEVDAFRKKQGIRCLCRVPVEAVVLPERAKTHVYRIFQEAMTNIARHANASRVEVDLVAGDDDLKLSVADNGTGLASGALAADTLGLAGMRERARQIGATLTLTSAPSVSGTHVELRLPLPTVIA
jgi:signal transduction histidine kinase